MPLALGTTEALLVGRVPDAGEKLELDGVEIEVLGASETQVQQVRIRKSFEADPDASDARPPADDPGPESGPAATLTDHS